jgi:hypothetical protein
VNHIELSARIGASPPILRLARADQVIDRPDRSQPDALLQGLR